MLHVVFCQNHETCQGNRIYVNVQQEITRTYGHHLVLQDSAASMEYHQNLYLEKSF